MSTGCVRPDGKPSERAIEILKVIAERGQITAEEISQLTSRPLFQIRSSLRELSDAGFLRKEGEEYYTITDKGREFIL